MINSNDSFDEQLAEVVTSRFLRKYSWLIEPSRKHEVNLFLMQDIVEFLQEIQNLRKEGDPLKIGLTLKNDKSKFEKPLVSRKEFHISKVSNFLHLKNVIDGTHSCYVIDNKGMIVIERLPQNIIKADSQSTLIELSKVFQTMAFFVGERKSEVYDSGEIIQINRKGIWVKPPSMLLNELERQGFPLDLSKTIFKICVEMSETYEGSTFALTIKDKPQYCSPMISDCEFSKCLIDELTQTEIIEIAKIDGAVVLDTKKEILAIGQKLEPPLETPYTEENGRGTRHNSAAKYSNAVFSIVFVVSEDGPISLYFRGNLHARCFGELFGSN